MKYMPENLEKWKEAPNYLGEDLSDHYVLGSRSDYASAVNLANWRTIERWLTEEGVPFKEAAFTSWVHPFELLMVKDTDLLGEALEELDEMFGGLEEYPLFNDDDWSQVEEEIKVAAWDSYEWEHFAEALIRAFPETFEKELEETDPKRILALVIDLKGIKDKLYNLFTQLESHGHPEDASSYYFTYAVEDLKQDLVKEAIFN